MTTMRTSGGRRYAAAGDLNLFTLERLAVIEERLDSDPRIASVSIVGPDVPGGETGFIRATAPAGPATVFAVDVNDLVGEIQPAQATPEELLSWAAAASDRGLWHDWLLIDAPDVRSSPASLDVCAMDAREAEDPTSSRSAWAESPHKPGEPLSLTVDVAWLGPHETGAQVLTTAALQALARHPSISKISLVGATELPRYAQHLLNESKIQLIDGVDPLTPSDIVWFPNQIDQRSNLSEARTLGRRVVTTYLDLIAYDIPRYHGGFDAWAEYRRMQRAVALSVDGITTISADVANRLLQEVRLLDPQRVRPIPLGLDHMAAIDVPSAPPEELTQFASRPAARPFVLVLGNDFIHKNRDFAIKVWEKVLDQGVSCDLVLAGLHVRSSSSKRAEGVLKEQHTNLRGDIHTFGHLSTDTRNWLLHQAAAVLYPSSAEGFGFVPYEAALLGTPTTFVDFGPLKELTGVSDGPRHWSVDEVSSDLTSTLTEAAFAARRVETLQFAAKRRSWAHFADDLTDFFAWTLSLPKASPLGGPAESASISAQSRSSSILRLRRVMHRWGNFRSV